MNFTGKLIDITKGFPSQKIRLTFEIEENIKEFDEIQNGLMDIEVKKYREKRSLDTNSYFHLLVGKIAEKIPMSKSACKNMLIGRYGQIEYINDEMVVIKTNIPPEVMAEYEILHTLPCGVDVQGDKEINYYRVYRGSSTYNTKEMSILIDGTVSEAQDLGIETMTPKQIERIMSLYDANRKDIPS